MYICTNTCIMYISEVIRSSSFENLDAHGWYERAKELVADDYFYQALPWPMLGQ